MAPPGVHGAATGRFGARTLPRRGEPAGRPPQRLRLDRSGGEAVPAQRRLDRGDSLECDMSDKKTKGDRVGPWLLEERLGEGGNGEVWRAVGDGERRAALKML